MLRRINLDRQCPDASFRAGWEGLYLSMREDEAAKWLKDAGFWVRGPRKADWCFPDPDDVPDSVTQLTGVHGRGFGGEPAKVSVVSLDGIVCVISIKSGRDSSFGLIPAKNEHASETPEAPCVPDPVPEMYRDGMLIGMFSDGESLFASIVEEYGEPHCRTEDSVSWCRGKDSLNLWIAPEEECGPHAYQALNFFDTERWDLVSEMAHELRQKNLVKRGARYGLRKPTN